MVVCHDRSTAVNFFWDEPVAAQTEVRLRGPASQHANVRRVGRGDVVRLVDGRGHVASGRVVALSTKEVTVAVDQVVEVPRPLELEVVAPVADRDRMLLAAEKGVELQMTAWRPAYFDRSRSVRPRGEGSKFKEKLRARMQSALEQCGGAWLPTIHDEADVAEVLRQPSSDFQRLLLDSSGQPLSRLISNGPAAIAVGPEGGMERLEIAAAQELGWVLASLGATILRFETAVIAGLAVLRSTQMSPRS